MMKTVSYRRNGPANCVLEFVDRPVPKPAEGEVLVKLSTSGVNPSDVKSRAGRAPAFDFVVPHSDGAGVIEAVGEGVDPARLGQRVWIWNGQWQRQFGTAAEYICVHGVQAVQLDDEISFETAACFGIPGLTAAHAVDRLSQNPSKDILVIGAASAVGHYVTQMAAAEGRNVIGTASSAKQKTVLAAGATAVIDYKSEDVAQRVLDLTDGNGVGAVIDMDFYSTSNLIHLPALQARGTIYCYGSNDMGLIEVPFRELLFKSISLEFFLVYELTIKQREAAIERLSRFALSDAATTCISHVLTLDQIVEAHELVESGRANGNVVLTI